MKADGAHKLAEIDGDGWIDGQLPASISVSP